MTLKKQEHLTLWLSGYVDSRGEFHRNPWAMKRIEKEDAIREARQYTAQGNETLVGMGVEGTLTPAVVKRDVYYDETEPEEV